MKHTVIHQATATIPTKVGSFKAMAFEDASGACQLCLVYGKPDPGIPIYLRIQSQCITGEVFGSLRCDCGPQLAESMRLIAEQGRGVIIYLEQEGRGIGLLSKLRAYELQDSSSMDTIEANVALGLPIDDRNYDAAVEILHHLAISKFIALTNNPQKIEALREAGFQVTQVPLVVGVSDANRRYLQTKKKRLGHIIPDTLLSQED